MAKKTRKKTQRKNKRMRGGQFNVPISKFYPQNSFENDPSRNISSSLIKGGKKHSRKYLRGGNSGFFSQFGTIAGVSQVSNQIAGAYQAPTFMGSSYKV